MREGEKIQVYTVVHKAEAAHRGWASPDWR